MKKVLFIDRDGTLIVEPPVTFQVNSLDEMVFLPGVIGVLRRFVEAGFHLVIVTNQDGLGTEANPTENYERINRRMLDVFAGEGVTFEAIFCCPHTPQDACLCRKPKTAMVDAYLAQTPIDRANSYMIGDRPTDMAFAEALGITGLLLGDGQDWKKIAEVVLCRPRTAEVLRTTKETAVQVRLNLDGTGSYRIETGLNFFNHMLEQLAKHSGFDLEITCRGDLHIDEHHTIEDVALALGDALRKALGDKRGIERFAWERILVMDEAKTEVSLDLSGRPFFVYKAAFTRTHVGDFPTEMLEHFFHSLCTSAGINANMIIEGKNTHHMVECSFKALARCLRDAVRQTSQGVSSTKGML